MIRATKQSIQEAIRVTLPALVAIILTTAAQAQQATPAAASCSAISRLALPHTRIVSAEPIAAGALPLPAGTAPTEAATYRQLPTFCRVIAQLAPTSDSDIKIEVWMPTTGWNGKFRGQGNGGFAGEIDYRSLALAVSQGYASAGTDTGHAANFLDASWALGHPEKVADFGYRAVHEMTVTAKSVVQSYYSAAAKRSYFASCSDGGREALMEAQRFPADYDGILAGAPAYNWTNLITNAAHNSLVLLGDPASYIPPTKIPAIGAAVAAACDTLDGVKDGVLNDPRQCRFDAATLLCKGAETDKCLSTPQMVSLKALYAGLRTADGALVYPGYLPGSEEGLSGWSSWITGNAPGQSLMFGFANGYFTNMVYENPKWDYKTFTIDAGLKAAQRKTGKSLDATNPDLKPFVARGGKLILYHGWNDPAIAALNTIDYYDRVVAVTGKPAVDASVRLYMVPGMQHCGDGPGPTSFGQFGWAPGMGPNDADHIAYKALEQWVEQGTAPKTIVASKSEVEWKVLHKTITRPLCPYPQAAKYKGSGDTDDADNFVCAELAK